MSSIGKSTNTSKVVGVLGKSTPSRFYKFFLPCAQDVGSGSVLDLSGKSNNAIIESATSDAAVWAVAGAVTTTGAATGSGAGVNVPTSQSLSPMGFDLASGKSMLWSFQIKLPTNPTGSALRALCGSLSGASGGIVFYVGEASAAYAGRCSVRIRNAGGSNNTYNNPTNAPLVNDGNFHNIVVWVNGSTKTLSLYVDGILSSYQSNQDISAVSSTVNVPNIPYGIGHYGDPSTTGTTGTQSKNHHCMIFNSVPTNINDLIQQVTINPSKLVEDWMVT